MPFLLNYDDLKIVGGKDFNREEFRRIKSRKKNAQPPSTTMLYDFRLRNEIYWDREEDDRGAKGEKRTSA